MIIHIRKPSSSIEDLNAFLDFHLRVDHAAMAYNALTLQC